MDTFRPSDVLAARILVVDDQEDHLRIIEFMLAEAGYTCVSSTLDPREVTALHRKNRFDLIVLDLKMPGMDGFQVMADLRDVESDEFLPILAVTAEPDHLVRALNEGARDFIAKPVRMEELHARVRSLVKLRLLLKQRKDHETGLERLLERRTAKLQDSEGLFRALVEQSIVGLYVVEKGRFTYVNPRMCEILGYSKEALQGLETISLVAEEDREKVRQNQRQREAGEVSGVKAVYRVHQRDGQVIHLALEGKMIEREGCRVLAGIAQDVTERMRAKELLFEAEGQYRALVEQSAIGIYIISDKRLISANHRLSEITGFSFSELSAMELRDLVIDDDHGLVADALRRRKVELGPLSVSCRARCKDGRIVHLSVETKVVRLEGRRATIGMVEDVSERVRAEAALRESEEKYRLLWETASDAVILMGEDMRIQYANPAMKSVFGYAPEDVQGRSIALLQPERLREPHRRAAKRYLETGVRTIDWRAAEVVGLHRDGHEFPLEIGFSQLTIGGVKVFAAFMRDITERKRAQVELEKASVELHLLSRRVLDIQEEERRAISSELHDDIGQSLLALKIGLHRLGRGVDQVRQGLFADCLAVTEAVCEKLRDLSTELRPPQLDQLGLRDALRWLVRRQRGLTGLAIECCFSGAEDTLIPTAVEIACYRICQEALTNATRHARAKAIRVELESQEGSLELAIRDDGIGFDAPAMRANALNARAGLGLISMEERARFAGGKLEMRSVPGAGTCVAAVFSFDVRGLEPVRAMAEPE